MSAAISERIHAARSRAESLRIVAGGTWLDAGRPCPALSTLDLSAHTGVTRYEPGDFVLSARGGTPLEEIERIAAAHGQWLTLDPVGRAPGTIGATIATASYGPLCSAFGTPRDHILGCEFVSGTGDVVRAGGQVVKNVAGFDLVRLVTGAWGTLGVISEVTLRMRARPEVDRSVAITVDPNDVVKAWRWLRDSEFTPLAAELLSPELAQRIGLGAAPVLLMRFGGNEPLVNAALTSAMVLGELREQTTGIWNVLRDAHETMTVSLRASAKPSRIDATWAYALALATPVGGFASATLTRGVVRCSMPSMPAVSASEVHVTLERIPADHWPAAEARRGTRALDERVRIAFDPDRVLNPGILDV